MQTRRTLSAIIAFLAMMGSLLLGPALSIPADAPAGYVPVGPPAAVHRALESNLKVVGDWLNDKDYASAAETTRGLTTLAHLYGYHLANEDWRKRCTVLQEATTRLGAAARRKSAADSENALQECARLLEDLAQNQPKSAGKVAHKDFKPQGGVKTWMLVMDGTYIDAKAARNAKDVELLAQSIAAQVHAAAYLKADPRWRKSAAEVRETALAVAKQARTQDLAEVKKALRGIYQRCELCHQRYQK